MIPFEQLCKRAKKLYNDVKSAKVFLSDGTTFDGVIKKKTIEENVVKVFVSLDDWNGVISRIEIYDIDDEIMQVQYMEVFKTSEYKFLAVVEIRVENEVLNG